MSQNKPLSFCVYGTLRDDDDSGAPWTESFLTQLPRNLVRTAYVTGFKMMRNTVDNYPFALRTNMQEDKITVRVLSFPEELFQEKLVEADGIEMYDRENPEKSVYDRVIVEPVDESGHLIDVAGILYFVHKLDDSQQWSQVEENDWMKRNRKFLEDLKAQDEPSTQVDFVIQSEIQTRVE